MRRSHATENSAIGTICASVVKLAIGAVGHSRMGSDSTKLIASGTTASRSSSSRSAHSSR
jgi:hypothetical protein